MISQTKKCTRENPYFLFPKSLIKTGQWQKLPHRSKVVLLDLMKRSDKNGRCFPSIKTIALYTGLCEKTVKSAIRDFEEDVVKIIKEKEKSGYRRNLYYLPLTNMVNKSKNEDIFPIFNCVYNSSRFLNLPIPAKCVYITLRYMANLSYFYEYGGGDDNDSKFFNGDYKERNYDYCEANHSEIARLTGMTRDCVLQAINSLKPDFVKKLKGERSRNGNNIYQVIVRWPNDESPVDRLDILLKFDR